MSTPARCWGLNSRGCLGLGDLVPRGDDPGEMGDALPATDLGAGLSAASLDLGTYVVCTLLQDGSARCWGKNEQGQLGLGDTTDRGDMLGEMGDCTRRLVVQRRQLGPCFNPTP